jgi:mannose-6-phosphate isomerase-like protein (cupin superfamily)
MANLPCLLVTKQAAAADPALQPEARGARKHVVTSIFDKKEREADDATWLPPTNGEKCPVIVANDWEMATFTEVTAQDRHHHLRGTEIYMVLSGTMVVDVNGVLFFLYEGDMLIVNPGAVHEVLREGNFLARVITVNCGGADDKYVV